MTTEDNGPSIEELVADIAMIEEAEVEAPAESGNDPSIEDLLADDGAAPEGEKAPAKEEPAVTSYDEYREHVVLMKQRERERQLQWEQERQEMRELAEQGKRWRELEALKKSDPEAYAEAVGVDHDTIVTRWANAIEKERSKTPEELAREAVETAKEEAKKLVEAELARIKEETERRHNETLAQNTTKAILNDIQDLVASDPDKYELLNITGQQELVFKELENFYQQHGMLPRDKEGNFRLDWVAEAVETKLRTNPVIDKYLQSNFIKSRLAPGVGSANNSNGNQAKKPVITLTNKMSKTSAEIVPTEIEDDDAAFQEALKMVKVAE